MTSKEKALGVDQIERLMWGAFWDCVHGDKELRGLAMPDKVLCAMADRVHEYLPVHLLGATGQEDINLVLEHIKDRQRSLERTIAAKGKEEDWLACYRAKLHRQNLQHIRNWSEKRFGGSET